MPPVSSPSGWFEIARHSLANLTSALQGVDAVDSFIPCVAPASVYWFRNEYYATEEEFVYALADALRIEYRRIHAAGIMVHVDDAVLWHMFGTIRLRGGTPEDYRRWAQLMAAESWADLSN